MKITEKIFDVSTGEETIVEREETAEETNMRLEFEAKVAAILDQEENAAIQKAALLAKLGITADEAKLLLS
jgi:hypothetical protein